MAFSKATELLDSLKNFGVAYGPAAVPLANGKALELWLMLKLAEGAKKDGWAVDLCDGAGAVLAAGAPFRPRGQHGKIARASSNGPGFIRISKGKSDGTTIVVELHDSLQWNGRSDASHECDLSVIDAGVAQALRTNGGGHPIGLPLIAIECKDKDSAGPIGDVREQVARLFDLTHTTNAYPKNGHRHFDQSATVGTGLRHDGYGNAWQDGYFAIVRHGAWQPGAAKLAKKYTVTLLESIYDPATLDTLVDSFAAALKALP